MNTQEAHTQDAETTDTEIQEVEPAWLVSAREQAQEQAESLSKVFDCEIEAVVFVVEPEKDIAFGFLKKPDAMQGFKLLRMMGESFESGVETIIKAQLIRTSDLEAKNAEGSASDYRFMDANGNYDKKYSELNLSLFLRASTLVTMLKDQFKKK